MADDPWEAAFGAYRQSLVDYNGDGIPDAVIQMPQGMVTSTPPPTATGQDRRQIQRRGMAGLEPTEQQNALLRASMPQLEANSERLGNFGMELTGFPQVLRAGTAIGEAYTDPSIANFTNAGAQSALAAFRPLAAGKVALGGLGAAAVSDVFGSEANAQAKKSKARPQAETISLPGLEPDQQKEYNNLQARLQSGNFGSAADRRAVEGRVQELRKLSDQFASSKNTAKQDEYNSSVKRADTALNRILSDRPKKFNETSVGQVYDKLGVIAPGVIGAGGAAVGRLFSGGGTRMKDYIAPMIVGGATGGVSANWPLGHELIFQPPGNTERKAYQAYARELPAGHPRKQEMRDYAQGLERENPDRAAASQEFYDPIKLAERTGMGVAEGLLGGLIGAHTVGISERGATATRNLLARGATATRNFLARKPSDPGRRGEPPEVPPNPPVTYRAYSDLPQSSRSPVQEAYLARGGDLPPHEGAAAIKQSLAQQSINVPVTARRVNATNQVFSDFVRQNGRLPTQAESGALFNRFTLGLAGAAAGAEPVNNLMAYYQGQAPTY